MNRAALCIIIVLSVQLVLGGLVHAQSVAGVGHSPALHDSHAHDAHHMPDHESNGHEHGSTPCALCAHCIAGGLVPAGLIAPEGSEEHPVPLLHSSLQGVPDPLLRPPRTLI